MSVCQRASPCHRPYFLVNMSIPKAWDLRSSGGIFIRYCESSISGTKITKVCGTLHDNMLNQLNRFSESPPLCIKIKPQSSMKWSHTVCILCENINAFCTLRKRDVIFPLSNALKKQMIYGWGSLRFRCKYRMHNSQLLICTQLVEHVITCGVLLVKRL